MEQQCHQVYTGQLPIILLGGQMLPIFISDEAEMDGKNSLHCFGQMVLIPSKWGLVAKDGNAIVKTKEN